MNDASLIIVGSGIKFLSHLTIEAKTYIEQSNKVLYLVNDPILKEWIQKSNPNSESLDEIYFKFNYRSDSYNAITEYILKILRTKIHLSVVLYGHPSVCAQPALDAVIQARKEGYHAEILPGISSEDCLFADLLINPLSSGCQSYEATDFLICKRKFDSSCHLIIFQLSMLGNLRHENQYDNSIGLMLLIDFLTTSYSENHPAILYEAAQYPSFKPVIIETTLKKLIEVPISRLSTLYIPPLKKTQIDKKILEKLSINLNEIQKTMND